MDVHIYIFCGVASYNFFFFCIWTYNKGKLLGFLPCYVKKRSKTNELMRISVSYKNFNVSLQDNLVLRLVKKEESSFGCWSRNKASNLKLRGPFGLKGMNK